MDIRVAYCIGIQTCSSIFLAWKILGKFKRQSYVMCLRELQHLSFCLFVPVGRQTELFDEMWCITRNNLFCKNLTVGFIQHFDNTFIFRCVVCNGSRFDVVSTKIVDNVIQSLILLICCLDSISTKNCPTCSSFFPHQNHIKLWWLHIDIIWCIDIFQVLFCKSSRFA